MPDCGHLLALWGSGIGISVPSPAAGSRLQVSNGTISGMGQSGIDAGSATIRSIQMLHNAQDGVHLAGDATVIDSVAAVNGRCGFFTSVSAVIVHNVSEGNLNYGFVGTAGSTVMGNTSSSNAAGFEFSGLSGGGVTMVDNVASFNTSFALRVDGSGGFGQSVVCGYGRNTFVANNGGNANPQVNTTLGGLAIEIATNICGSDTVCP